MWRNNDTTARSPAGLLGLVATNCVPADIDDHSENPTMPNIVGNCPGSNGRPQPMLWAPDCWASASTALPLPVDALHCRAIQVVNARILASATFGAQGGHAVLEQSGIGPLVLSTGAQRSSAKTLNANGRHRPLPQHQWRRHSFLGIRRPIRARISPRPQALSMPR